MSLAGTYIHAHKKRTFTVKANRLGTYDVTNEFGDDMGHYAASTIIHLLHEGVWIGANSR